MKYFLPYILVSMLIGPAIVAQPALADMGRDTAGSSIKVDVAKLPAELVSSLKAVEGTEAKVDQLIDWSYEPAYREIQSELARFALDLSQRTKYTKGEASSEVKLGNIAKNEGRYDEAIVHYERGIVLRKEIGDVPGVAGCYNNMGLIEKLRGNFAEAVKYFRRGLAFFEDAPPHKQQATLYNNLGSTLRYQGEFQQAWQALSRSQSVAHALNLPDKAALTRLNIANLLQDHLDMFPEAHDSLMSCLSDFRDLEMLQHEGKCLTLLGNNLYFQQKYQEAAGYYQKALVPEYDLPPHDAAIARKNLGTIHIRTGSYDRALSYLRDALRDFTELGNQQEIAGTLFQIGEAHRRQDQERKAIEYFERAISYEGISPELENEIRLALARALHKEGRYREASPHWAAYFPYQDSLSQDYHQTLIDLKRAEEQNFKLEIDLKEQEKQHLADRSRTYRTFSYVGFGVMWLLLGLALMGYYLSRQRRRLAEQQEKLAQQQVIDLLHENELQANYAWLEGQEETRQRIGRELHDSLGSMLATIKMHFSSVEDRLGKIESENRQQYDQANRLLDTACEEVRRISHEMMSAILVKFGLKAQLESLAETIADAGKLKVELSTHGLRERLPTKMEFNIYRILQELVNNVIRHAKADTLSIQVNRFDNLVNIMVEDDGIGFDLEKAQKEGGMGMQNLAARIHDLDGQMNIDSRQGKGTHVSIDLPIDKTPQD